MEKYQNKYRIKSTRLSHWDYGSNAVYFVTICTQNRYCFFGNVKNKTMQLSEIGKMAEKYWYEIPVHFPFVKLGAFVVMPNHVHGIIIIDKKNNNPNIPVQTQNFASLPPPHPKQPPQSESESEKPPLQQQLPITSQSPQSIPLQTTTSKNKFGPQSQNLASIIRGYKIGVTKNAKKIDASWQWQSRYHDHIIRNETSFQNISNYIINNPQKWEEDKFHK